MRKWMIMVSIIWNMGLFAKTYEFSSAPMDVVIPCTERDLVTLDMCISSLRKNHSNIHRIIVVSKNKLTDKAEWFAESKFPFSKQDVAYELFQNEAQAKAYLENKKNRLGWLIQQLYKLYALYVIPGISENVFVVDADVVFLNPTQMISPQTGGTYFNTGTEYHKPYFAHAKRLIPFFKKVHEQYSGITHCMVFQKPIIDDLFNTVQSYHKEEFWKAFLHCIDHKELFASSASEYEIYFNYALLTTDQCKIHHLKWDNITQLKQLDPCMNQQYHYVAYHFYMREDGK